MYNMYLEIIKKLKNGNTNKSSQQAIDLFKIN